MYFTCCVFCDGVLSFFCLNRKFLPALSLLVKILGLFVLNTWKDSRIVCAAKKVFSFFCNGPPRLQLFLLEPQIFAIYREENYKLFPTQTLVGQTSLDGRKCRFKG